MLRFKQFINEWLNDRQKSVVQSWLPDKESGRIYSPKAEEISRHIIPEGQHAIVIPAVAHVMRAVHEHLSKHGYTDHDYVNGITKDKHGRIVSMGKALVKTKAPEQLKNDFDNDNRKNAADIENHDIIISRHPYHVAEGSTNKKWKSCNTLTATGRPCSYGDGVAARKLPDEIRHGTHVAYLVPKLKEGESSSNAFPDIQNRIDKSIARIYLKPYKSEDSNHTVLLPENKVYQQKRMGEKNLGFLRTLQNFTEKHFPMKIGEIYRKNGFVYDDDGSSNKPKFNLSDEAFHVLKNHRDPKVRQALIHSDLLSSHKVDHLIDHYVNPYDLEEIAERKKLSNNQIQKLLDKNIPNAFYSIARRQDLHPKFIDHIINQNDESVNYFLINSNLKSLTSDHLHKIIDTSIDTENHEIKKLNLKGFDDKLMINLIRHKTLGRQTLPKLLDNKNFDSSHFNKILKSNNSDVIRDVLNDSPKMFSDEQLQDLHKKWKPYTNLQGYNNPAKYVEQILSSRERQKEQNSGENN